MSELTSTTNLSPLVQSSLLRRSVMAFAVALLIAMVAVALGAPATTRALLFVPFLLASYMLHASLSGVCFMTSMRGLRQTCHGPQPVGDTEERRRLKGIGGRAFASTLATALGATALVVFAR